MAGMPNENVANFLLRFVITWISRLLNRIVKGLLRLSSTSLLIGSVVDLSRSKADVLACAGYLLLSEPKSRKAQFRLQILTVFMRTHALGLSK